MSNKPQPFTPTGSLIDAMYELKQVRKEFENKLKGLDEDIKAFDEEIKKRLESDESTGAQGSKARATITNSILPIIDDYDKVETYIRENDALYIMQRRLAIRAVKELLESGEEIPGVRTIPQQKISLRKLNK